jgi:glycosyltransferase involved in cell wall biosynthesis
VPAQVYDEQLSRPTDPPRFSIVIPAVNEASDIGACLLSLARQDYRGTREIIVVDNGSTDDTAAIAASLGATVVHEPRPGVCWARQRGTEVARGEIIVSTDADTTFDAGWLTHIDEAFDRTPKCVAVTGACRFVAGPWWGRVYAATLFGCINLLYLLTGRVIYVTATNIAFRKSAWTGYNTALTQGGDELDLLRRLRAAGKVTFDRLNPTFTSARRLHRGLVYNIFVTCLFYYLLGYALNRIFGRRVLGTAPAIRDIAPRRAPRWIVQAGAVGLVLTVILFGRFADIDVV